MREAVAELFLAVQKSRDLWVHAEKKARWAEIESSLINREKFFDKAMAAVNEDLSATRVD